MSRSLLVFDLVVAVHGFEVENLGHCFLFYLPVDVLFYCWVDNVCLLVWWDVVRWLHRLSVAHLQRCHHIVICHMLMARMPVLAYQLPPRSHITCLLRVHSASSAPWWLFLIRFVWTFSHLVVFHWLRPVVRLIRLSTEHFVEFVIQVTGTHRIFPVSLLFLAFFCLTIFVIRDLICVSCRLLPVVGLLSKAFHRFRWLVCAASL